MEYAVLNNPFNNSLSLKKIEKLIALIQTRLGIKMPEEKKTMLESRLHKRLKALKIASFEEYCRFLFSDNGFQKELAHLFDIITTNKTDFFREEEHFNYLSPGWYLFLGHAETLCGMNIPMVSVAPNVHKIYSKERISRMDYKG